MKVGFMETKRRIDPLKPDQISCYHYRIFGSFQEDRHKVDSSTFFGIVPPFVKQRPKK